MKVVLMGTAPLCTECGYMMKFMNPTPEIGTGKVRARCYTFNCRHYWKVLEFAYPLVEAKVIEEGPN